MLGKLLPVILALIGLGGGVGAGFALRPEAPETPVATSEVEAGTCECLDLAEAGGHGEGAGDGTTDFVKMNNQFVLPVVKDDDIAALVVLSISLEVPTGGSEIVYQREPKLRDRFLQVLFDHANTGGFDGMFTAGPNMETLRKALLETALQELGRGVVGIVITDIARQDM